MQITKQPFQYTNIMKKSILYLFMIVALVFGPAKSFSQIGASCDDPYVINEIPFELTDMSTSGNSNIFNSDMACESEFMNGKDFVFTITPDENKFVNISLSNTSQNVGLFLLSGCPSDPTTECIAQSGQTLGNPSLNSIILHENQTYYIVVSTKPTEIYGFVIGESTDFNISISEINPYDLQLTSIVSPSGGCGAISNTNISVEVKNNGLATANGFEIAYQIDDGDIVTKDITEALESDESEVYNFDENIDFEIGETYTIKAWISFDNDSNNNNDTTSKVITIIPLIDTFPYHEDFEGEYSGWVAGGTNSSWELGTPYGSIAGAPSGTNAWATSLTGYHNDGENSWVASPCFDLSNLDLPVVELKINYNTTMGDIPFPLPIGASTSSIDYSIDGGSTWNTLGENGDIVNWYNSELGTGWTGASGGWITAKRQSPELAGESNVRLRVKFNAAISSIIEIDPTEGIAFDDFKIYDMPQNDVSVVSLEGPINNCNLSTEFISVKVANHGALAQNDIPIYYTIDDGENYTSGNVIFNLMYGDTAIYTFPVTANFINVGVYNVQVFTALPGDEDLTNDTLHAIIINSPVVSEFPYLEDFESDEHNWEAGGTNSTWEVGVPVAQSIPPQSAGNSCMITNASGNYNPGENSFVTSPCFDFSSLSDPYIKFKIFYNIATGEEDLFGGPTATLQISLDGGYSWEVVGENGEPNNWYNSESLEIFPGMGGSVGWTGYSSQWLEATHKLESAAGMSNVKLRVSFGAAGLGDDIPFPMPGGDIVSSGFAFDDVEILECIPPNLSFYTNIQERTVSFNNTSTGATSYTWDFGDGQTSNSTSANHTYANDGIYTVTLTGENECTSITISEEINVGGVGINEASAANINCVPNPNNGNFRIEFTNINGKAKINLINTLGQLITTELIDINQNGIHNIDASSLSKGIYFVEVQTSESRFLKKIIIK